MRTTEKDNSLFVQEKDLRIDDYEIEFWENWLPKKYAQEIHKETGFSVSLIQKVKRGWRFNSQIVAVLNQVAGQRKKDLLNN